MPVPRLTVPKMFDDGVSSSKSVCTSRDRSRSIMK
jgi:hypothetical protein